MELTVSYDTDRIRLYLEQDPYLHLYALGDLDEFFRPMTRWYGWTEGETIQAVVLVYKSKPVPTILALTDTPKPMVKLLGSVADHLPDRFYAHMSPGVADALTERFTVTTRIESIKMGLHDSARVDVALSGTIGIETSILTESDIQELRAFYAESYSDNWFEPQMVKTGRFVALRDKSGIAAVAGVHVYSPRFSVAAIGNVATRRDVRNRGYGRRVTADLCRRLLSDGLRVGLNVRTDNAAAIAAYRKIGFRPVARYRELGMQKRSLFSRPLTEKNGPDSVTI